MVTLHAFLSLLAGFATLVLSTGLITALFARVIPDWASETTRPQFAYAVVNIGYSFLCAAAGGYVTAWLAVTNPMIHALALALIVLVLSALNAMQNRGKQPIWFLLMLLAITPIGVLPAEFYACE